MADEDLITQVILQMLDRNPDLINKMGQAGQTAPINQILGNQQQQAYEQANQRLQSGVDNLGWDKFGSILGAHNPLDTMASGFQKGVGMRQQYTLPQQMIANRLNLGATGADFTRALATALRNRRQESIDQALGSIQAQAAAQGQPEQSTDTPHPYDFGEFYGPPTAQGSGPGLQGQGPGNTPVGVAPRKPPVNPWAKPPPIDPTGIYNPGAGGPASGSW